MAKLEEVRRAESRDDASLRACLRDIPMEGRIRLLFEREPSFFGSLDVHGDTEVVVGFGRDEMAGFALRSANPLWVEGEVWRVGYLGNLRVKPPFRGVRSMRRGFDMMLVFHAEDPVPFYFTTIQESNTLARRVLEAGRFGMPKYRPVTTITSHVFSPRAPRPPRRPPAEILSGESVGARDLASLLAELGPKRNLFPVITENDFATERTRGLELSKVFVAAQGSHLLGMLAMWQQTDFKQVRVTRYPRSLRVLRPLINASAGLTRRPHIPPSGETLDLIYASLPVVRDDRPDVFRQLLAAGCAAVPRTAHIVLGLTAEDPLLPTMTFPAHRERFRLYTLSIEGSPPTLRRPAYVEGATL